MTSLIAGFAGEIAPDHVGVMATEGHAGSWSAKSR